MLVGGEGRGGFCGGIWRNFERHLILEMEGVNWGGN